MKKMIVAALCLLFMLATATPVISKDNNRDNHGRREYRERSDSRDHRDYRERSDYRDDRDYRERSDNRDRRKYRGDPDYRGYRGYRDRPYDKYRHYDHHEYRGRSYTYNGHWRSWDQWDGYARQRPDTYRQGNYYRESGHLMFRFCEPGAGNCFFFSIGR